MGIVDRINRVAGTEGPVPWKGAAYVVLAYGLMRFAGAEGCDVLFVLAGLVALAGSLALLPRTVRSFRTAKAGE
ncbi:hypothetical protein EG835_04485 [bacterium]|nr:hypothetical protein [bacterium]